MRKSVRSRLRVAAVGIVAVGALGAPMAGDAAAQQAPRTAVELAAGWIGFADDGVVSEVMVGGSGRYYVFPRVAIGPEVQYIQGNEHSHLVLTGNLTFDVRGPVPRVTPFVVVGGGLFQTRDRFPSGPYTSSEGAFTAGGGIRARIGERATVGVEARIGWELHLRVNGTAGWRFGN